MNWPKISIITPSYNQGEYIEQTIISVIGQQYPNLEYIIIDGGSNDNSINIIKKYEKNLQYWCSEVDSGQSEAINKGLKKCTGDIIAWLNSDDMYMPGALFFMAQVADIDKAEIYYTNCIHYGITDNSVLSWATDVYNLSNLISLDVADYITQPSSFWTRKALLQNDLLNESLHFAMDWEWFLRAKNNKIKLKQFNDAISIYRVHPNRKTENSTENRLIELRCIYQQYNPFLLNLFDNLLLDRRIQYNFLYRLLAKIYRIFQIKYTIGSMIRLIKPHIYLKYSKHVINMVISTQYIK
jgi:glycosyltransferase involved in cell wall biosynthesis